MTLGLLPGGIHAADESAGHAGSLDQAFLRIASDDTVTVIAKHLDMGQGIWSGLASIVAEELDAAWVQMRVEGAPADRAVYKNLIFGAQTTGGSTSIANSWDQLRHAGATARAMLVAAAAARWNLPQQGIVVDEGVVRAPDGRSARLGELAAAAALLPVPTEVSLKDPSRYRFLGKRFPRLDSGEKSTGRTHFGIDLQVPGMKVAMVMRPPRFGATLTGWDAAAARACKGVVDVVQIPSGVAVVADSTWLAMKAREALAATWNESSAEHRSSAQMQADFDRWAEDGERINCLLRGAPDSALAGPARVLAADFHFPYLAHAALEPIAAVCILQADQCELIGGFQNVSGDQAAAAKILGLAPEKVRLTTVYAGGSFGRRATFSSDWVSELAHIAKATGGRYPVKLVWSREDTITAGYYRPMSLHRLRAALGADGKVLAVEQRIVAQSFLFGPPKPGVPSRPDPTAVDGAVAARYDIPHARLDWINPPAQVPVQMFRALSFNHTTFSKEVFMDELARAAAQDPVAFRLAHLGGAPRQAAVLRLAAEKSGWGRALGPGRAMGVAVQEAQKTFVAQIAQIVVVAGRIRVERVVCAVDCGFALNPDVVAAQMEGGVGFGLSVALQERITFDAGRVEQSNFNDYVVLRMPEYPADVQVHVLDSGHPPTGVGEPGSVLIAAAVANALASLTGRPVRTLPLAAFAA